MFLQKLQLAKNEGGAHLEEIVVFNYLNLFEDTIFQGKQRQVKASYS